MSAAASDMPDPLDDLVGCLHKLADLYGDEWAFSLIGKVRDHRGPGQAGQVRVALAQRIVEAEMRTTGDQDEAMRIVAERLGYHGWTRRNTFYKIARGVTRHGKAIGDEE